MLFWRYLLRTSLALCWLVVLTTRIQPAAAERYAADSRLPSLDVVLAHSAATASTQAEFDTDVLSPHELPPEVLEAIFPALSVHEASVEPSDVQPNIALAQDTFVLSPEKLPDEELKAIFSTNGDNVDEPSKLPFSPVETKENGAENEAPFVLSPEELSAEELKAIFSTFEDSTAKTALPDGAEILLLSESLPLSSSETSHRFSVFPVGLDVGDRNALPTSLVKGTETSTQATDFSQWLLPFEDVMAALNIRVTTQEEGDWELRSPGSVIKLSPNDLQNDTDLGLVLSIQQIEMLLGVPAQFNQKEYAIRFDPPWLGFRDTTNRAESERPVVIDGLPLVQSSPFAVGGIAQQLSVSGGSGEATTTQGELSALGSVFGGSWYLRAAQRDLASVQSWQLRELQYLRQNDVADVVIGSQPTFWDTQGVDSAFWGATYVRRFSFSPPKSQGTGGFSPDLRRQSNTIGRTVTGEAAPGTLVQLTQGFRDVLIDEVLVDSSGLYRFENVDTQGDGQSYQVRLYPNGLLTATPEIRTARFSTLAGQLPAGASALVVSAGANQRLNNSFTGEFQNLLGGVAYRRGITESVTLGTGLVQDGGTQMLAEAFYAPAKVPLKISLSSLANLRTGDVDIRSDIDYRPSPNFYLNINQDRFTQRFSSEWRVASGLTLLARGNTRDKAISGGARFLYSNSDFYFLGDALIDTKGQLRWNVSSRRGAFAIRHSGNEITTQSELAYNLSGGNAYSDGHGLSASYSTQNRDDQFEQLAIASWRYRSPQRTFGGRALWNVELGYGIGSQGSGLVASLTTGIVPGLDLRARYQGVSTFSDRETFQIEVLPRITFQSGLGVTDRDQNRLRTQGGLLLQPFLDENGNGTRDKGEPIYSENLDLLFSLNHRSLSTYRPEARKQGIFLNVSPDVYRLDLDPAGYPLDWRANETTYAVETTAGHYTSVEIPLSRSYILIGSVTDAEGNAIAGQRVEAIETDSEQRRFSITNSAGVFYLEGLSQGSYQFEISGSPANALPLVLDQTVEGLQEINFQVFPDGIETKKVPSELEQPVLTQKPTTI